MRKRRVVIGVLAIVVIGVVFFVRWQLMALSQPRKGTAAYHKLEFLKTTKPGPVAGYLDEMGVINDPKGNQREFHRRALVEAGYLRTATFVVSNRPMADVWLDFWVGLGNVLGREDDLFTQRSLSGTNGITVVAPKAAMDTIGAFIRQLDVKTEK